MHELTGYDVAIMPFSEKQRDLRIWAPFPKHL